MVQKGGAGHAMAAGGNALAVSRDFVKQLAGYGLTTAHILYRLPDHPSLLQTYLWQHYDLCPQFPELNRFLTFWRRELEGPLHSVTVAHSRLVSPAELRAVDGIFRLN
ncbi:usg protein [Ancylobacter sp. 6x-1]|uniref:Usg protein n=1 Tax=Ancylobacter crimeensis TaxID=2579147 RepID=A0ABT0DEX0_9HYPH|nr:usg protein [Ancylobacter crimeensis]MCK0198500.1 usg protein [Ancylobacter crimeensis]